MGVRILGILTEGKVDMTDILQIKTPKEKSKEGVGLMALRDRKVGITRVPSIILFDGIEISATLDEILGPNMM
jgi:hypothetical protein